MKMETVPCPKTSVRNYHFTLYNIPEEHRSHLHVYCDGSLNHTINLAVTGIWLLLLLLAFGCYCCYWHLAVIAVTGIWLLLLLLAFGCYCCYWHLAVFHFLS